LAGCRSPDSIFIDKPAEKEHFMMKSSKALVEEIEEENTRKVQVMPRFSGCEDKDMTESERLECSNLKLVQFVYENLRYPDYARSRFIKGNVYAQFTVLKNGNLGYVRIVKDIGGRCGNTALWVINRMNFTCDKWTPGMQDGKPVDVLFTLPVKFRLE